MATPTIIEMDLREVLAEMNKKLDRIDNNVTAISDQTHHEKAISKAQSRDHNVGTNQEHFHQ
jgi:chaperonin cofactor prefoldin